MVKKKTILPIDRKYLSKQSCWWFELQKKILSLWNYSQHKFNANAKKKNPTQHYFIATSLATLWRVISSLPPDTTACQTDVCRRSDRSFISILTEQLESGIGRCAVTSQPVGAGVCGAGQQVSVDGAAKQVVIPGGVGSVRGRSSHVSCREHRPLFGKLIYFLYFLVSLRGFKTTRTAVAEATAEEADERRRSPKSVLVKMDL